MKQLPPRHSDPLLRFYHLLAVLELVHRLRVVPACSVVVGNYWWIKLWTDVFVAGKLERKRVKLAPADTKEREILKIVDEYLRPINQNLESIGSATNFTTYVNETYFP